MPAELPALSLFVVELKVRDWAGAVRWYEETLGLPLVLRDSEHGFALFGSGGARIGLKAAPEPAIKPCRLIFQVENLEAEQARLCARGVEVGPPSDNEVEGYREIRLHDPEGTPITLFQWLRPPGRF